MPNHIMNKLELYHDDPEELEKIIENIGGEFTYIDFNKLVRLSEDAPISDQLNCWGTKWNAYDQDIDYTPGSRHAMIQFHTAWSPPAPIIKALAEKFPDLVVSGGWIEEGWQSCGTFHEML